MARSSDRRVWARLTVDFADSPKVVVLSDAAFRALVEMILWCRRGETDGVIPRAYADRRWGYDSYTTRSTDPDTSRSTDPITELRTNHPERPSLEVNETGDYVLRDFLEHQESRKQVEERKARNSANIRRRWERRDTNPDTSRSTGPDTSRTTGSNTETETETEEVLRTSSGGSGGKRNDVADRDGTEVAPAALPATTTPKRTDRATRLPDDWAPSPALIDWTRTNAPDVQDSEVDRFRDYWHSAAGAKARKVDWDAVWRNWARRAQDDANTRRSRQGYRNQAQIMQDVHRQAQEATIAMRRAQQGSALQLIAGEAS